MPLITKILKRIGIGVGLVVLLCSGKTAQAQYADDYRYPDSVFVRAHSPNKATFYSAILPGLGQIYNEMYWKVPLIYAGIGSLVYYTNYNNFVYNKYKDAYDIQLRIDKGEDGLESKYPTYSADNLKRLKDNWRRNRDLCIIGIGIFYVAQIIDADVDAHLFDYDMSEDLSMRVEPVLIQNEVFSFKTQYSSSIGLRCSIQF
jgi:hypothetical protein